MTYNTTPILGALTGDIVGSVYEWHNIRTKEFPLFDRHCFPTDDSVMTLAVAKALMKTRTEDTSLAENTVNEMRSLGRAYPRAGYGGRFAHWLTAEHPTPYNSFGNGSAMRTSACGVFADTLEEALENARTASAVTHDHPEGIKGAEAVTAAIFMGLHGSTKEEIRDYIGAHYYTLDFTLDEIRPAYRFDETCQGTVPQAIEAFLEANGFEDTIRNAISLGGDSDTLAAIAGSIAAAYYGVPRGIEKQTRSFLDEPLRSIYDDAVRYAEESRADKEERKNNMKKHDEKALLTELVFILDRSGSMAPLTDDTIGGYNSLLEKQRGEAGKAVVTTVLFDDAYDVIVDGKDLEAVRPLDDKTYYARGMTALLDAVGKTLTSLEARQRSLPPEGRPDKTVIAIITDGQENASREYSLETVRKMIEQRKRDGCEFLFLGANIDAVKTAGTFGIGADRAATYCADAVGTRMNFAAVSHFMAKARACEAIDDTWKEDIERYEKSK